MFHTCKTLDDANRLHARLRPLLSKEKGGEDWMVRLLDESHKHALIKLSNLTPEKAPDPDVSIKMLTKILAYGENRPDFDCSFFLSVKEGVDKYGKMTEKQSAAVANTYDKFKLGKK